MFRHVCVNVCLPFSAESPEMRPTKEGGEESGYGADKESGSEDEDGRQAGADDQAEPEVVDNPGKSMSIFKATSALIFAKFPLKSIRQNEPNESCSRPSRVEKSSA